MKCENLQCRVGIAVNCFPTNWAFSADFFTTAWNFNVVLVIFLYRIFLTIHDTPIETTKPCIRSHLNHFLRNCYWLLMCWGVQMAFHLPRPHIGNLCKPSLIKADSPKLTFNILELLSQLNLFLLARFNTKFVSHLCNKEWRCSRIT